MPPAMMAHPHLSVMTDGRPIKEEWESSFSPLANFKLPYQGQRSATGLHSAAFDPARRFSLPMDGYQQQPGAHGMEPIHSRTPSLTSTFASEEDSFSSPSSATSSPLPDAPFIAHSGVETHNDYAYPLYALGNQSLDGAVAYRAPQVPYAKPEFYQSHYLPPPQLPLVAPVSLPTHQQVIDIEQQRQTAAMMMMAIPQQPAPPPPVFASGSSFPALPSFETTGGTYFFVPHGSTVTQHGTAEYRIDLDEATKLKTTLKRSLSDDGNAAETKKLKAAKAQVKRFICPHAECGRAFARNFNMASHYKSHLGIRDFNCDFCSKKFSRRHDKQRHESSVHAEELQDNDD